MSAMSTPVHKNVKYNFMGTYAVLCKYLKYDAIKYNCDVQERKNNVFHVKNTIKKIECDRFLISHVASIIDGKRMLYNIDLNFIGIKILNSRDLYNNIHGIFMRSEDYKSLLRGNTSDDFIGSFDELFKEKKPEESANFAHNRHLIQVIIEYGTKH